MEALALKESLAEKLAVPEEKLLFGNGASELLMAVVHALHPTKIMIPSPSFYGYQHAAKAVGSKVIPLMLKEENGFLLTEELFTVLEQERPELLILANPNNPTGVLTSKEYLKQLLEEKGLERSRVVRMADLNETFGYQIFTGSRNPSRNKVLQIAFAMALTLKETNRALTAAGVSVLNCKDRRDAIIIFCIDRGCSLQKVNEELYRFGEETVS